MTVVEQEAGLEVQEVLNPNVLGTLTKAELDMAVTTAKAYPRSITRFQREVQDMATLNDKVAEECMYALQRRGKGGKVVDIVGPSARFAEIVLSAWGNCRAMARLVDDTGDFVRAQGMFMDMERNVTVSFEVQRRVTDSHGRRFSADMVMVTANAAAAIALRNAVLRGVPKAFWTDTWDKVQAIVKGDASTLEARRAEALSWLAGKGVVESRVFAALDVAGVADIGLDELLTLKGLVTAVRNGDVAVETAFPNEPQGVPASTATGTAAVKEKLGVEPKAKK